MVTEVKSMTLLERIRQGNDILWSIWLDAQNVADDKPRWSKAMNTLERGVSNLQYLVFQARNEGYNECCYGEEKYLCLEREKICFACTFNPPEKCACCGSRNFWFSSGDWICNRCHPKL